MPADRRSHSSSSHERSLYMISAAAELAGIHPQTLRDYERRGLLEPARSVGNTRRYSSADVERVCHIVELTRSGLNLEGVRLVLDLEETILEMRRQITDAARELEMVREQSRDEIDRVRRSYRRELMPFVSRVPAIRDGQLRGLEKPTNT